MRSTMKLLIPFMLVPPAIVALVLIIAGQMGIPVIASSIACNRQMPEEQVAGVYQTQYPNGVYVLFLKPDHTYDEVYVLYAGEVLPPQLLTRRGSGALAMNDAGRS